MTAHNFPGYMASPAIGSINPKFRKQHNGGFLFEVYGTDAAILVAKFPGGFQCVLVDGDGTVLASGWFDVSGVNAAAVLFLFDGAVQNALGNDTKEDTSTAEGTAKEVNECPIWSPQDARVV